MTEDELFEQSKKNLADAIQAEEERKKRLSTAWSIESGPSNTQNVAARTAIAAVGRFLPDGRPWAIATDPESCLQFGALARAAVGKDLNHILKQIAFTHFLSNGKMVTIGLLQDRPNPDAGVVDWPIDQVSKQPIRNPWLPLAKTKESDPGFDWESQKLIETAAPRTARWMKDCARHGGATMAMSLELENERRDAEAQRGVVYTEREWKANRLRRDLGANLTERMQFEKSITDPWLRRFHRKEAEMGSPRLFDNRTFLGQLRERSPEAREVVEKAHEIYRQWKAESEQKEAA